MKFLDFVEKSKNAIIEDLTKEYKGKVGFAAIHVAYLNLISSSNGKEKLECYISCEMPALRLYKCVYNKNAKTLNVSIFEAVRGFSL